ncbi:hypothetical protein ACXWOU_09815, partial [Streptococcus pyogenes]
LGIMVKAISRLEICDVIKSRRSQRLLPKVFIDQFLSLEYRLIIRIFQAESKGQPIFHAKRMKKFMFSDSVFS